MRGRSAKLTLVLLLVFFATGIVFAVTINPNIPGVSATDTNPCSTVFGFYTFALMIGGILAFAAITYGGVKYTLAAGNPSGQSEGKEWVKGAIYGLLLLVGAYLILNLINPSLTQCNLPTLGQVSTTSVGGGTNPCAGVTTCGGGDGTCEGSCPLDSSGKTQICQFVGGGPQKGCVVSSAGVACGGATNGSCPIDPSTGKEEPCVDSCGFPSSCFTCVAAKPGGPVCGVPPGQSGSCASKPAGTTCQPGVDSSGVTTFKCCLTTSPFTCF